MSRALYPGSFDPVHNGHIEIVETSAKLFDSVVVAAMGNPQKGKALFSTDERQEMLVESLGHLQNVSVVVCEGLVVDLAKDQEADFILKGLRGVTDFESELQMARMNHAVTGIDTIFLPSTSADSYIASKYIRDITRFGGDVTHLVPPAVAGRLREMLEARS